MIRFLLALFVALPLTLSGAATVAQTVPRLSGPLTILVGYPPGGTSDRIARVIADRLKGTLGVPVIVENRPGAGGRLAAQVAARAGARDNLRFLAVTLRSCPWCRTIALPWPCRRAHRSQGWRTCRLACMKGR